MPGRNKLILLILIRAGILFFFVSRKNKKATTGAPKLTYKTYSTQNGWGYRIFAGDTLLLIQQDVVPGMPGEHGFDTEARAAKTAGYIISKIHNGIFPPTVSPRELDSLGVL